MDIPVTTATTDENLINIITLAITVGVLVFALSVLVFLTALIFTSEMPKLKQAAISFSACIVTMVLVGGIAAMRFNDVDRRSIHEVITTESIAVQTKKVYGYTLTDDTSVSNRESGTSHPSYFYTFTTKDKKKATCELIYLKRPVLDSASGVNWASIFLVESSERKKFKKRPVRSYPAKLVCGGVEPAVLKS